MKLKIAQVIGLNTDQKAAQVTFSQREDNSFLGVLELTSDDAFTKGRQILSELEDYYFEFEGAPPEKLSAVFSWSESKFPEGADSSICLAAMSGKVLYIIGKGQTEVYLKRGGKLSSLLSVGASSQLISGFIIPGDRLLFATSSLISFLGPDLEKSLDLPVGVFEEEIGGKIGASDLENQSLAALLVSVLEDLAGISSPQSQETLEEVVEDLPGKQFQFSLSKVINLSKVKGLVINLGAYFPENNKARLILGIILFVVIVSGIGYKYKSNRDKETEVQFNQLLQQARDDFNVAKGLGSPTAEAKNKLDLAKEKVNKALLIKPKDSRAEDFKKQIESDTPSILQEMSVADFPVFLDMDLVKKNFRADNMSLSTGKLLLLDPGTKTLVMVDLAKKSNQILAGSESLGDAVAFSLNGKMAFIFSKDKGILRVDTTNQKLVTVAKKDSNWGEIKDLYAFAGNVYLLDTGGQIWKYLSTSDGYSDKREYLTKDTKADFNGALRMQIESSIYVLKNGGEILRFTKGDKDNFSYAGLSSGVKDPKSIFTSSDIDNLYVLDSGNSRLLILTKTGSFKGQITGDKFKTSSDLVVDEVGEKVYLLEGGKIFQADLK